MKNSKASALAIALSLMVLLTGLGLGALNYSGMQGQVIVNQKLSTQAFWLADAGLQQALANGGASISNIPLTTFGNGTYLVNAVKNGNSVTLTSTGTVSGSPTAIRTLQAVGTLVPLFNNAVIAGSTATSAVNVGSGVTIDNYNSNGSAGTGNGTIETNATGITGAPATGMVQTTVGVILPVIPPLSNVQVCPSATGLPYAEVDTNLTFAGSGTYTCSYLYVAPGATLTIDTPVVLYLTATDPATGPDPINGEDLRGGNDPNNFGYVKIVSGGSLTIYAAGRVTTGQGLNILNGDAFSETLNNSSFVELLNQNPPTNPNPANLIIYSLYNSPVAWSSATAYAIGDLVTYAGGAWQSIVAGTDQPPSASSLYWENIAWNSTTDYSVGSFVYYNGLIWQSVLAGSGNAPTAFSADLPVNFTYYWNTYASVEINNNIDHFYGLIYSPQSLVWLNLAETLSGSVVANMVNIQKGTDVNYDQSLQTNTNLPTAFSGVTNWKECSSATSC